MNNMEKILYRGFANLETVRFKENSNIVIDKGDKMYKHLEFVISSCKALYTFLFVLIVIQLLYSKNNLSPETVTTIVTLLLVFKGKCSDACSSIGTMVEMIGRSMSVAGYFDQIISNYRDIKDIKYISKVCSFDEIKFENLDFFYKKDKPLFKKFNLLLNFTKPTGDSKIIGIYGPSGYGKSSLAKLLIGVREFQGGNIFINKIPIHQ